jgi:hypothetical protein
MVAAVRSVARALAPAAVVIGLLAVPGVAQAVPNPWTPTGSYVAGTRTGESLVALHDGSVLAIGGSNLSSVERYDPASGTWTAVAPMANARANAVAVTLADGTVLVAGGDNGGIPMASAERYDPASGTWAPAAPMAEARRFAMGAQLLPDGTVLVAGGIVDMFGNYTANAERYDPATDSWSSAGSLSAGRGFGTLTLLSDGTALAAGGVNNNSLSANVDRYDPAAGTWSPAAALPTPTWVHTATRLADGRVLVAGGDTPDGRTTRAETYDPHADSWTAVASMSRPRTEAGAVPPPNGDVLLVGGESEDDAAEVFDPTIDRWLPAGHVGTVLTRARGFALNDGSALVAGGGQFGDTGAWRFSMVTVTTTAAVDFGEQTTRRRGPVLTLTVRNDGDAPLYVTGTAIQGPHAGDFSLAYDQCAQGAVTPGSICLVGVRFTPSGLGARTAALVLAGDLTGGSASTALSGVGVAPDGFGSGSGSGGTPVTASAHGVRCSARSGRAVTCSGLPARLAGVRGAVVLKRGRATFARGTLRGGTLTLNVRRRLFHARYRLVVVGHGARARTSSIVIV